MMKNDFKSYYDGIPKEITECSPEEKEKGLALEIEKTKAAKSWDDIEI